jgi:hypothetical protein
MLRRPATHAPRALVVVCARRWNAGLAEVTKGNPHMSHLDLYARRDPQLAPYLLREIDIEYKRKCRKVNFVFWIAMCTTALLYDQRVSAEAVFYLREYAELIQDENEAKDRDNDLRRAKLVGLMGIVKQAFERDGKWTVEDYHAASRVLLSSDLEKSQSAQHL